MHAFLAKNARLAGLWKRLPSPFLEPLDTLTEPTLVNAQTGVLIASSVEVARTSAARRRGLLGRDGLPHGSALVISRCNAIHTVGMRFAIDVVFVDSKGRVRKVVCRLPPWRLAISPSARVVIELGAGELRPDLHVGDRLALSPSRARGLRPQT